MRRPTNERLGLALLVLCAQACATASAMLGRHDSASSWTHASWPVLKQPFPLDQVLSLLELELSRGSSNAAEPVRSKSSGIQLHVEVTSLGQRLSELVCS